MTKRLLSMLGDITAFGFLFICTACCLIGLGLIWNSINEEDPPVESNVGVDTIIAKRDSIKVVINNLDSIKDAKVIEVKALDNDSTVKLFYELIGE